MRSHPPFASGLRNLALVALAAIATGCPPPPPPPPVEPDPSRSEISVDRPTGALADGADQVQIRVTVRDSAGAPVSGVVVQLAATGQGNTLLQPAAPSDDAGVATGALRTTVAEGKTVSATLPQGPLPSQATVVFAEVMPPPPLTGVRGTRILHHVTDTGLVDRPVDLSRSTIGAYVPDDAGGFTHYSGTGTDAGTFSIPDVPAGAYLLQFEGDYVATAARVVDLSSVRQGRPDAVQADAGTQVHVQLTGMTPWTPQWVGGPYALGNLHLTAPNAGVRVAELEHFSLDGGLPSAGVTELDLIRDYRTTGFARNLLDAAQGDRAYVVQYVIHDAGPNSDPNAFYRLDNYKSVASTCGPFPLSVADRQLTEVSCALSPVPQQQLQVTWPLDAGTPGSFASYRTDVNPNASTVNHRLVVNAAPVEQGYVGFGDWLIHGILGGVSQPDRQLVLEYGNPFPSSWIRYATVETQFRVSLPMGLTSPTGSILVSDLLGTFPATPMRPQISPVQGAEIAGVSLFSDQTLAATTPLMRWSPPALGVPTYYRVRISELQASSAIEVARLTTTGTQIRVPPGIFQSGRYYNVVIAAVAEPGSSMETAPFLPALPRHSAEAIGGLLTVP